MATPRKPAQRGTQAPRVGKKRADGKVYSGENYGYQTPASHSKLRQQGKFKAGTQALDRVSQSVRKSGVVKQAAKAQKQFRAATDKIPGVKAAENLVNRAADRSAELPGARVAQGGHRVARGVGNALNVDPRIAAAGGLLLGTVSTGRGIGRGTPNRSTRTAPRSTRVAPQRIMPGVSPNRSRTNVRVALPPAKAQMGMSDSGRVVKSPSTASIRKAQANLDPVKARYTAENPSGLPNSNYYQRGTNQVLNEVKRRGGDAAQNWKETRAKFARQKTTEKGRRIGGTYDPYGRDYHDKKKVISGPAKRPNQIRATKDIQEYQGVRSQGEAPKKRTAPSRTPQRTNNRSQDVRLSNGQIVDRSTGAGQAAYNQHYAEVGRGVGSKTDAQVRAAREQAMWARFRQRNGW